MHRELQASVEIPSPILLDSRPQDPTEIPAGQRPETTLANTGRKLNSGGNGDPVHEPTSEEMP